MNDIRRARSRFQWPYFVLPSCLLLMSYCAAADQLKSVISITDAVLDEVGDADIVTTTRADTMADYQKFKEHYPNPQAIARFLSRTTVRGALEDVNITFDDAGRKLVITAKRLGTASRRRQRWEFKADLPYEILHIGGRTVILTHTLIGAPDAVTTDILKLTLPASSRDIRYDRAKQTLSYLLDREPKTRGPAVVDCEFETRRNIMSGLYKIYGQPEIANGMMWVGRAVVRNAGDADVTDVRISYRTGELSSWSPESRYDLLPAGGTLVDCYYPIYNASSMNIDNATPVEIEARIRYRDASGEQREETVARRSTLLGRTSFEFSYIPEGERVHWADHYLNAMMLSAFVTKNDPVIREFASLISRHAGAGAMTDDAQTMAYCYAVYNQLLANGVACRNPAGFLTEAFGETADFKYPRDVLREKRGNAMEIAALFASVCAASGLDTGFQLTPGTCSVMVRLPSGTLFPLELSGMTATNPATFEDSFKAGLAARTKTQPAAILVIDVAAGQQSGIVPPELPPLPQGTLAQWGLAYRNGPAGTAGRRADADLSGRWRSHGLDDTIVFDIKRDGSGYGGVCLMDERDPDAVMPIISCVVNGDGVEIVARVSWKSGEQDCFVSYMYSGEVGDDGMSMRGKFRIRMRRPGEEARETPEASVTLRKAK